MVHDSPQQSAVVTQAAPGVAMHVGPPQMLLMHGVPLGVPSGPQQSAEVAQAPPGFGVHPHLEFVHTKPVQQSALPAHATPKPQIS
jgi:hypothetical protein